MSAEIAYFSMEIGLAADLPTYAGGLGVLAGDTLRTCADLGIDMVAVTLVHRKGYFRQRLSEDGVQSEEPSTWSPEDRLERVSAQCQVEIEGRSVQVGAWVYRVIGASGDQVPVLLLDTDLPENEPQDRRLTDSLYGGDDRSRLSQEVILGIGGLRLLRALGHTSIRRFHLNEGHAALLSVALLEEHSEKPPRQDEERLRLIEEVRRFCVFTTHTPVPAGHDRFDRELAEGVLGAHHQRWVEAIGIEGGINMTELALAMADFVNGVAMRHGEVSRGMFPDYPIRSITNGVHAATWATPAFRKLYDRHVPGWRRDPLSLRYAVSIPLSEIAQAHHSSKRALLQRVNRSAPHSFDAEVFTIGFARRATAYKRATLLFRDLPALMRIAERVGAFQIVLAGKAHPQDEEGKAMIQQVFRARDRLRERVNVVYLENYDMELGALLCGGCDLWLNTPVPPLEASGTSGMKAAVNGVPSLSVLDGWWIEGCVPDVTGWAIGEDGGAGETEPDRDQRDAAALVKMLETTVLPRYYKQPDRYLAMMRSTIAINASFFNTQRMVLQYLYEAYPTQPRSPIA